MCDELNGYFSSVFNSEDDHDMNNLIGNVEQVFSGDLSDMLCEITFFKDIICNKLRNLPTNKAPGLDGLVPLVFFETADVISLPLFRIFSKSIDDSVVPSD